MLFTGNPGSAKTTVARLLAEILKKEETIETGNFVECGRADLVARYVGWTAKTVREKFNEANGGILFIDEAYSLIDDPTCFGAEAINTIVQEMENRRDSVIVIFAGYPDKMEKFLNENEGLRSRIAFHLNFPDYNADELLQILELMAGEKGFKINSEIKEKCHEIFAAACSQPEFGNGRFVRNVLEQAMMRQADRVVKTSKGKPINKRNLTTLIADDFVVNEGKQYEKKKNVIGFV
jgi:ATPases of the AAA+ class